MEKTIKIKWDSLPNKKIKEELISLKHEHIALKNRLLNLMENLEDIEKEYYLGNNILSERYKPKNNGR